MQLYRQDIRCLRENLALETCIRKTRCCEWHRDETEHGTESDDYDDDVRETIQTEGRCCTHGLVHPGNVRPW